MRNPKHMSRELRAGLLGLAALALAPVVDAGCQIHPLELPVRMSGERAVATVGINGTKVPLTVDTGAFFSFLTEAAATQLALPRVRAELRGVEGITGAVDTYVARVDKLQLLGGEVSRVEFVVGGNEPGRGTMGLMGRNMLAVSDTEYDLSHGAIRFPYPNDDCARSNMAYWAGSAPVTEVELETELRARAPAIRARVRLNGREFTALFDTGATSTLVSLRAARRAGVTEAGLTPAGTVRGAGRGGTQAWTASFDTFEIGGETIRNNRLRVADFSIDDGEIILGIDFFLSHRIYVSKQQSKIFLTYGGGPVFAFNHGGGAGSAGSAASTAGAAAAAAPAASESTTASAAQLAHQAAASAYRRDYEGALADLNRACELDPASAALFAQRGAVLESLKRPAQALRDFDKALALEPDDAQARLHRAALRYAEKDREGAKADLALLDKALAPQAQARLPMSRLYTGLGEPQAALDQLNRWLPAHPHEVGRESALNGRCWTRAMLAVELEQALDDCNEAVDADAKNASYLDSRGWLYLRLANYQKAVADFDKSIQLQPKAAASLYGRALAKSRLGDTVQAGADLAAARQVRPGIDRELAGFGLSP